MSWTACPPARRASPACAALDRLGLGERASHYPDQLSGGERQRVAIARAMVGERRLLLADEPSGALDSANAQAVMRLLHDACKEGGMTAVVVTHDAQLASWADRVVFLRDGRVTDQTAAAPGPGVPASPRSETSERHGGNGTARAQNARTAGCLPAARSSAGPSGCCAANGGSSC